MKELKEGDLNGLFVSWLKEMAQLAIERGSQQSYSFNKALDEVRRYSNAITDPKTLKLIRFVGDRTVTTLLKKLVKYCKDNGYKIPEPFDPNFQAQKHQIQGANDTNNSNENNDGPTKKKRKKTPYIPKKRSGGYAILLALYLKDRDRQGLKKDEIIKYGSKFCDTSFKNNPANNEFYSAWNSMKQLEKHELVSYTGRRTLFFITDEGIEVAKRLKEVEQIHSSPLISRTHDISYDNGLFVSPNNSTIINSEENDIQAVEDPRDLLPPHLSTSPLLSLPLKSQASKSQLPSGSISNSSTLNLRANVPSPSNYEFVNHIKHERVLNGIKYSVWPDDQYDVIILIDNREIRSRLDRDYFQERLESFGVKCEVRQLAVGDVCWIAKHKVSGEEAILNTICERKRVDDLAASIKDGRFFEQKNRLTKSLMKKYYYLVEDTINDITNLSNFAQQLQTAQSMTMTLSKFQLRKFKAIDETTEFLASLTKIIEATDKRLSRKLIVIKARVVNTQQEYKSIIQLFRNVFEVKQKYKYECCHLYVNFHDTLSKTQMFTVKEMFLSMLMSIRGVSLERAIVLQKVFPTPKSLLDFYHIQNQDKSPDQKGSLLLDLFKHEIGNKKIGKAVLQKIYEVWGK